MFCRNCGKEIKTEDVYCPYCGKNQKELNQEQTQKYVYRPSQEERSSYKETKMNTMAIASFVIALVSLFLSFWKGGVVGLAALILSIIAMRKIRENKEKGKGFAVAGIIIGAISVLYWLCSVL